MTTSTAPTTPPSLGRTVTTTPDDTSIVMTRSFEAPRELVFDMWTDRELVAEFWGPAKHRNEVLEWDLRPGGAWRVLTHVADGGTVDFHGEFLRVERPSLIEWTFGFDDTPPGPETLFLDEEDGITTMRTLSCYPSREIRDLVLGSGMETGAAEMHDRFAALLARRLAS